MNITASSDSVIPQEKQRICEVKSYEKNKENKSMNAGEKLTQAKQLNKMRVKQLNKT